MKRRSLLERITAEDMDLYLKRALSTADISTRYNVSMPYVARTLPKRAKRAPAEKVSKIDLRKGRWGYRDTLAKRVRNGEMTAKEAAQTAHCSERTIFRHLKRVKNAA